MNNLIHHYLRKIPCFESDTCYSLAFGVPAALMLIATLILIAGKPFYVFKPPQGNVLTQVFGSIWVIIQIVSDFINS
jgi:solute carrier family 15 oligopeptide transporter 1